MLSYSLVGIDTIAEVEDWCSLQYTTTFFSTKVRSREVELALPPSPPLRVRTALLQYYSMVYLSRKEYARTVRLAEVTQRDNGVHLSVSRAVSVSVYSIRIGGPTQHIG